MKDIDLTRVDTMLRTEKRDRMKGIRGMGMGSRD